MEFGDLFQNINVPILVYEDGNSAAVLYENGSAVSLLNAPSSSETAPLVQKNIAVNCLLKMPEGDFQLLSDLLNESSQVSEMCTTIQVSSGERIPVILSANKLEIMGVSYVKLCINAKAEKQVAQMHTQTVLTALHAAFEGETAESIIQTILSRLGQSIHVSRISIYEAVSDETMSNTYEWCMSEVEARIESLQNIPRQQMYDSIMGHELVTHVESKIFSAGDETAVGASESQSMFSVPILSRNGPLGYMVIEDRTACHQWSQDDISLLYNVADILAFFITERKEQGLRCNWSILNTVTDHLDDIMYVNDIDTKEILFANRALSEMVSIPLQEIIGQDSCKVMQKMGRDILGERPVECMLEAGNPIAKRNRTWEFCNECNDRWYLVRSSVIKWIDDRDVYFETLTDITEQKKHEAKLEYIAATDRMTGIYNREWGYRLVEQLLDNKESGQISSLVFLDLDNLKRVNDCFGHTIGDQMIIKAVSIIQTCIRKSDFLCRWGGDEFLMIIRASEEESHPIMQKIRDRMDEYNESGRSLFQLKFSYGIVELNAQTQDSIDSLISEADQRMYLNKQKRFQAR